MQSSVKSHMEGGSSSQMYVLRKKHLASSVLVSTGGRERQAFLVDGRGECGEDPH